MSARNHAPPDHTPLVIGLVTDIHHGPRAFYRGLLRKLGERALDVVAAFVDQMNRSVRPDLVVHLGDAIEDVDEATDRRHYGEVMALLDRLSCPILHVTGNHEEIHLTSGELAKLRGTRAVEAPLVLKGRQILTLPSHSDDRRCWVDEDDITVFRQQLESSDLPAFLFMHHTLVEQDLKGNPWFEGQANLCLIENRMEILPLIRCQTRLLAVFNGHLHWNRLVLVDGLPFFNLHSPVENIAPPDQEPVAAEAWTVIEARQDGLLVRVSGNAPLTWELPRQPS